MDRFVSQVNLENTLALKSNLIISPHLSPRIPFLLSPSNATFKHFLYILHPSPGFYTPGHLILSFFLI
jgi:hypothetical protein